MILKIIARCESLCKAEKAAFLFSLENPALKEKTNDLDSSDYSRTNTPSISLDTVERLEANLDSEQEEVIPEDTRREERVHNHNSRVTFLLT